MPRRHGVNLAPQEKAEIVELYQTGMPAKEIAQKMDVLLKTIYYHLHKAEIFLDRQRNKILINVNRIASPIDELAAYWMGFFSADGHITKTAQFFLKLAGRDADHLSKYLEFLGINRKVSLSYNARKGRKHLSANIWFTSRPLAQRFYDLGVYRRDGSRPILASLARSRHFWRGFVDGDGHLGITDNKPRFILVGSKPIMSAFLKFARQRLPQLESRVTRHGSIYQVSSTSRPAQAIMKLLYCSSNVHLDRKKNLAERIMPLPLPDRTIKSRRKQIDETVFNSVTNESSYWIGYMFYGSYVGRRIGGQTPIEIHVGLTKQHHLKRLRDFLNSGHSVQVSNTSARLSFRSDAIASALARYGIVPGKDNRQISAELQTNANFWRGVADGHNKRLRKNMVKS